MDHRPERLIEVTADVADRGRGSVGRVPTMLLSRIAETMYWAGRYLERAESTARIVRMHTDLYLDLPKSAGLTWEPLLALNDRREDYDIAFLGEISEENVCAFLTYHPANPGSVLASLASGRENVRRARAVFPREAWEVVNNTYLQATDTCGDTALRWGRTQWMDRTVGDLQRLSGLLAGTMSHDHAYDFLSIGRLLERADMTSRVLDVRAGYLMHLGNHLGPLTEITWLGVLRSLSGYQMYRRKVQSRVQGPEALRFLLQDPDFPRSINHCLGEIDRCLHLLGHSESSIAASTAARANIESAKVRSLAWDGLHDFVDDLQGDLAAIHDAVEIGYFRPGPGDDQIRLASA